MVGTRGRARRLLQAALLLVLLLAALPESTFAQTAENCPGTIGRAPTASDGIPTTPFWNTEFMFEPGFRPTSIASDGQNIFMLDHTGDPSAFPPIPPKIVRLPLHERTYRTCVLPVPTDWTAAGADARRFSVLLLGPRAFYLVSNPDVAPYAPVLYRADRFPNAIRGGWRQLRVFTRNAAEGLDAVVENTTLLLLRSDQTHGYEVDWQPIESTTAESIVPPGTTIQLGRPQVNKERRPAAGVAVAEKAIYVFGGRFSPDDVVRIPLKNRVPSDDEDLPKLPSGRIGGRALIHARSLYLVGGNVAGKPTIERTAVPLKVSGNTIQWDALPEPPSAGGAILASTFAKGKLWIVRENGHVQAAPVDGLQPGKTTVDWGTTIKRQRIVQKGDSFTVDLPFKYSGSQDLTDLSVELSASLSQTDSRRGQYFASFVSSSLPTGTVLSRAPPRSPSAGPTLQVQVNIPTMKVRTEYVAIVGLRTGPASAKSCLATQGVRPCLQRFGQQLALRFIVDKRPPTPTPSPTPV